MRGIDVSSYQGVIDWGKAKKDGVCFAILKIIRKDGTPDKMFEKNMQGCIDAGVPVQGVYNYTYATTTKKAVEDAKRVLAILGARRTFVWLDYEDACLPTDSKAADIINAYGDVIAESGNGFGVYFGMSFYNSYLKKIMPKVNPAYRAGWEARYPSSARISINAPINESKKPNNFDGTFYGWQYSSKGIVDGIAGNVDLNEWYVDIEAKAAPNVGGYGIAQFIANVRPLLGVSATAPASEMLKRTPTISTKVNKNSPIVTELERLFTSLGFYTGTIEADHGKKPSFGNGMAKATMLYQSKVVGSKGKNVDGVISAGGYTWRKLLNS